MTRKGSEVTTRPGVQRYLGERRVAPAIDEPLLSAVIAAVVQRVNAEFMPEEILAPSDEM